MRLDLRELEVCAGSFRLGPLSLSVGGGEYLIVLGPTGAGKTVTLEAIAGLRPVAAGRIVMDERDVTRASPESRRIGFLYQDSLLFPHLSVRDNLAYGAHRLPRGERRAAIERLAGLLDIGPLLSRMPRGLSGGERQRVAIGRALAANPILLLLDEPMAALDPNSRHAMRETLLRLHRELGTTTIHVTHSFSEAIALADRIAVLIAGRLLQVGAPASVFSAPNSPLIARFLKSAAAATGNAAGDLDESAPVICAGELSLRTRADNGTASPHLAAASAQLMIGPDHDGHDDALAARVVAVSRDRGAILLTLNVGVELRTTIRTDEPGARLLVEGASVWVRLPREGG